MQAFFRFLQKLSFVPRNIVVGVVICWLATACQPSGSQILPTFTPAFIPTLPPIVSGSTGQQMDIPINKDVVFPKDGVQFRVIAVADSRCPSDVACVVPGEVQVTVQWEQTGEAAQTWVFSAMSGADGMIRAENSTQPSHTLGTWTLKLLSVRPYPQNHQALPSENDYLFTFWVEH
ncbi:MAG TPA: hypothetical protein PK299_11170 [Anaerolineales bacterium]|nr:hypothetical protein [Anaerolineales bacterium]